MVFFSASLRVLISLTRFKYNVKKTVSILIVLSRNITAIHVRTDISNNLSSNIFLPFFFLSILINVVVVVVVVAIIIISVNRYGQIKRTKWSGKIKFDKFNYYLLKIFPFSA